jgi:anaerobic sulfite reductase subunit A
MENNTVIMARQNMYRFLSSLYLFEVDEAQLTALKGIAFPMNNLNEDMQEGYEKIATYLAGKEISQETLDELAVDYARIFLSAGVAQGKAAFPYESVYTSKQHLIMQDAGSSAASLFAEKGLQPREDMYRVPEDHLGLLLEYMALHCGADAKEQQAFLQNHLCNWVPAFALDVNKYASTDFYKGVAKLTKGFLTLEKEYLAL